MMVRTFAAALVAAFCCGAAAASTITFKQDWESDEGRISVFLTGEDTDGDGWIRGAFDGTDLITAATMGVTIFDGGLSCEDEGDPGTCQSYDLGGGFDLGSAVQILLKTDFSDFGFAFISGPEGAFANPDGAWGELVSYGRYTLTKTISIPTAIPLPASAVLLLASLGALGLLRSGGRLALRTPQG